MIKSSFSEHSFFRIAHSFSQTSSIASLGSSSDVQQLHDIFEDDVEMPALVNRFGAYGNEPGQFKYPCGLTLTGDSQCVVTDNRGGNSVLFFDDKGQFSHSFACAGAADVTVTSDNEIVVACYTGVSWLRNASGIRFFEKNGNATRKFYDVSAASSVCTNNYGEYVVSDQTESCIALLSKNGRLLRRYGKKGKDSAKFGCPMGVCTNSQNDIIVSDTKKHCLFVFDYDGNFVRTIGRKGKTKTFFSKPGRFWQPERICVDSNDNIYVADSKNNRVQVLSKCGHPIRCIPVTDGRRMMRPLAVTITPDNHLLVSCVGHSIAEVRKYKL